MMQRRGFDGHAIDKTVFFCNQFFMFSVPSPQSYDCPFQNKWGAPRVQRSAHDLRSGNAAGRYQATAACARPLVLSHRRLIAQVVRRAEGGGGQGKSCFAGAKMVEREEPPAPLQW